MKTDPTIFPQFEDSERRFIQQVNDGVINYRVKGSKKAEVLKSFADGREQAVKTFQKRKVQQRIPMKMYSFDRYKEVFKATSIPSTLKQVKGHVWADGIKRDTVWVRKLHEDEAECDYIDEAGVSYEQKVEDGVGAISEQQVQNAFNLHADTFVAATNTGYEALPGTDPPQAEDPKNEELAEDMDNYEDDEEYECGGVSSALSRLLGVADVKSSSRRAQTVSNPKARVSSPAPRHNPSASPPSQRSAASSPRAVSVAAVHPRSLTGSAGKDSKEEKEGYTPSDIASDQTNTEALSNKEFKDLLDKKDAVINDIKSLDVFQEMCESPTAKALFQERVGTLVETSMKIYKDAVAMHIKLGKRTKESVPQSVLSSLLALRTTTNTTQQWLALLKSPQPDHGKLLELNSVMAKLVEPMPLAFSIQLQKTSCMDSMRGGHHEAMAAKMSIDPPGAIRRLCQTTVAAHQVNTNLINDGMEWYLNSMSKGPRSKGKNKELLQHLLLFFKAISDESMRIVDADALDGINHFIAGFDPDSDQSKEKIEASQKYVLELNSEVDYQGMLFGLVNHPHFSVVKGLALDALELKQAGDTSTQAIDMTVAMFNSFGNDKDVKQFRAHAEAVLTQLQSALSKETPNEKAVADFGPMTFLAKKTLERCIAGIEQGAIEFLERCAINASDQNFEAAANDVWPRECDVHVGCAKAMNLGTYFHSDELGCSIGNVVDHVLQKFTVSYASFEVPDLHSTHHSICPCDTLGAIGKLSD